VIIQPLEGLDLPANMALIVKNTKLVGTTTVDSKFFIASFKNLKKTDKISIHIA